MWPFRKHLSTDLGGLGERVKSVENQLEALAEDYSAFKETQTAFRKRMGMRWARESTGGDTEALEALRKALQAHPGANGGRSQREIDFGEL
jgi:hypothetical protein